MLAPEGRGRLGRRIGPQAPTGLSRVALRRLIRRTIAGCLLPRVLPVPPGVAGPDLLQAHVAGPEIDAANLPAVPVAFRAVRVYALPVDETREALLGGLAERLGFLRGVYAGDADAVLDAVGIEDRHRVAVLHCDHPPPDLVAVREPGRGQRRRRDPMTNA